MIDKQYFEKDINVPGKEQIMIDGCNVSGCEWFKDGMCYAECDLEGYTDWECHDEDLNNCYFKQLARKTQEYEKLKEKYLELKEQNGSNIVRLNTVNEQLDQLKTENEELKEECEALKLENQELWRIKVQSLNEKLKLRNTCYRKALEEIEKVINNILNSCLGRNTVSCRPAHNVCGDLIKILDIINKAKEGE